MCSWRNRHRESRPRIVLRPSLARDLYVDTDEIYRRLTNVSHVNDESTPSIDAIDSQRVEAPIAPHLDPRSCEAELHNLPNKTSNSDKYSKEANEPRDFVHLHRHHDGSVSDRWSSTAQRRAERTQRSLSVGSRPATNIRSCLLSSVGPGLACSLALARI